MISRETRLLVVTILMSVAALWVLARLRFQERAVTPAPVAPVLAQLRAQSSFDDLASSVADLRPRVAASIVTLRGLPALRVRRNAAVTVAVDMPAVEVSRRDRATGIAVMRVPDAELPQMSVWSPRTIDYPRYLIAVDVFPEGISLRPVFVGALAVLASPMWADPIWALPDQTDLTPGTFVFASEGSLAGLVVEDGGRRALVPAGVLLRAVDGLLQDRDAVDGEIGVAVQPLSAAIRSATGARAGVIVTWVEPDGPASRALTATDIIEAIDGQELPTPAHWLSRIARLKAGDNVQLRVRRGEEVREVAIVATPITATPLRNESDRDSLGLTLRTRRDVGAEVIDVAPQTAASRAGIAPGDVITAIGPQKAPTASQISRAYGAIAPATSVLVAITRGTSHHVVALDSPEPPEQR
jgi:hypothetical protein